MVGGRFQAAYSRFFGSLGTARSTQIPHVDRVKAAGDWYKTSNP